MSINHKLRDGKALVRVGSHRARERLYRFIRREPQGYFSYQRSGEWREVTVAELAMIKTNKLTGITASRWQDDLRGYTNYGESHGQNLVSSGSAQAS